MTPPATTPLVGRLKAALVPLLAIAMLLTAVGVHSPAASAQESSAALAGSLVAGATPIAGALVEVGLTDVGVTSASGSFQTTTATGSNDISFSKTQTETQPGFRATAAGFNACPDDFAPDDSLGGICVRFEPASQSPESCPDGARGTAPDCYILVAKGPSGTPTCATGELVGTTCVIYGDDPVPSSDSCPIGPEVLEDADGSCYTPVAGTLTCVAPDTDDAATDMCRRPVPLVVGPSGCASGFGLVDGNCITSVDATAVPGACPDGSADVLGECQQSVAAITEPDFCPDGVSGTAPDCYVLVEPDPGTDPCPIGATPSEAGTCEQAVEPIAGSVVCPDGVSGTAPDCYVVVDRDPDTYVCAIGELFNSSCVIEGEPPAPGTPICPVSDDVMQDDDQCYSLITPQFEVIGCDDDASLEGELCVLVQCDAEFAPGFTDVETDCSYAPDTNLTCPELAEVHVPSASCREPVDRVLGPLTCANEFAFVGGECLIYETPVTPEAQCPAGSTEDDNGDCRKPVAPAAGAYFCADETAALNGTSCVFTAGFQFLNVVLPEIYGLSVDILDGTQCSFDIDPDIEIEEPPVCIDYAVTASAAFDSTNPELPTVPVNVTSSSTVDTVSNTAVLPVFDQANITISVVGGDVDLEIPWNGTNPVEINVLPDAFCNGQLVTINMLAGASGIGTDGDDVIMGTDGNDVIMSGRGNDTICGLRGNDNIQAGSGSDTVFGGKGDDTISGDSGNDDLRGNAGTDVIRGGAGANRMFGSEGNDILVGGSDDDEMWGNGGDDKLSGKGGADNIKGGSGNDKLRGGADNDVLGGGGGIDSCAGDGGVNTVTCEVIR